MPSLLFDLPDTVSFGVPRQYASFCNGRIVQVDASNQAGGALCISWDESHLTFESRASRVRYRRDRVVGLFVNPEEVVKGHKLCTLRAVFTEDDGRMGALPILTTQEANAAWIMHFAQELANSEMPVTTQVLPK